MLVGIEITWAWKRKQPSHDLYNLALLSTWLTHVKNMVDVVPVITSQVYLPVRSRWKMQFIVFASNSKMTDVQPAIKMGDSFNTSLKNELEIYLESI